MTQKENVLTDMVGIKGWDFHIDAGEEEGKATRAHQLIPKCCSKGVNNRKQELSPPSRKTKRKPKD